METPSSSTSTCEAILDVRWVEREREFVTEKPPRSLQAERLKALHIITGVTHTGVTPVLSPSFSSLALPFVC
jgi:hypothetical protein